MKKKIICLILVMSLVVCSAGNTLTGGTYAAQRYEKLPAMEKKVHDYILDFLQSVAEGKEENTVLAIPYSLILGSDRTEITAAELGLDSLIENGRITEATQQAFKNLIGVDINTIILTILLDRPDVMFWYDKTEGIYWTTKSYSCDSKKIYISEDAYEIYFYVSADYSSGGAMGTTRTDPGRIKAGMKAVKNAQKIVEEAKDKSDYGKLRYFAEKICELTGYDKKAYESSSRAYGDPWQFVNVFDGDSSTNVVCEGYSKAFKLLCDLATFDSPLIECQLVSGIMSGGTGAGNHMWNLVTMDDGKIYMADITNCDDGSTGQGFRLFLRGCASGKSTGYTINIPERTEGMYIYPSTDVGYTYNEDTRKIFSASELTIAKTDYESGETSSVTSAPKETTTPTPAPKATSAPTQAPKAAATPTPVPKVTSVPTQAPKATPTPMPKATATPAPSKGETVIENDDGSTLVYYPDGKIKEIRKDYDEASGSDTETVTIWDGNITTRTESTVSSKNKNIKSERITTWTGSKMSREEVRETGADGKMSMEGLEVDKNGDYIILTGTGTEKKGLTTVLGFRLKNDNSLSLVSFETKETKISVPDTVTLEEYVGNKAICRVTTIAAGAFKKSPRAKQITIGGNLKEIEKGAFSGAKKLKTVKVKASKETFKEIKNLLAASGLSGKVKVKRVK